MLNRPDGIAQMIVRQHRALRRSTIYRHAIYPSRLRAFSSSPIHASNPPPPPPSAYASLPHRSLISVTGTDTAKFLHGLVAASIPPPSPATGGIYSAFLTAQGRVLFDVFLYPRLPSGSVSTTAAAAGTGPAQDQEAGYIVEVDSAERDALVKHLKRHKLRSKVKLRALENGELEVWSAWREEGRWNAYGLGSGREGGDLALVDQRAPGMGRRLLLPPSSQSGGEAQHAELEGLEEASAEQYRVRRYLKGVPEGQAEIIRDQTLPMACNLDLMGAIDFKKGCYVGQELTIRTHHTGVVRRRMMPVQLYKEDASEQAGYDPEWSSSLPQHDAEIALEGKRGKPGKWIAGVGNVGLAMCRLEMMTDLAITSEPGSFSADDRFSIRTGGSEQDMPLGIKAIVPDWLRNSIRAPKVQKRVE